MAGTVLGELLEKESIEEMDLRLCFFVSLPAVIHFLYLDRVEIHDLVIDELHILQGSQIVAVHINSTDATLLWINIMKTLEDMPENCVQKLNDGIQHIQHSLRQLTKARQKNQL